MRIKEFSIVEYGPLPDRGRISLSEFNLFYGKNESGKTLTIDALLKILNGKNIIQFKNINRVEEKPEGYIIISDDKDKDFKLKGPKNISNLIDLSFEEFNNLFIIRDSDLDLYSEDNFYNTITDRLLGLRINDVDKITENLRDLGKLTPTGKFSNIKPEKFDDRINDAENCIEIIKELYKKIEDEQFDKMEEEQLFYEEKLEDIVEKIENYENARKREIYEKGIKALDESQENQNQIKILEVYHEKDKENWKDFERELNRNLEIKNKLITNLDEYRRDISEKSEELKKKESEFQIPNKKKTVLQEEIKRELGIYEIKRGDTAKHLEMNKFFTYFLIISTFLLGCSLIGLMISPSLLSSILTVIFTILILITLAYKVLYFKDKAWVKGFFERLNLKLVKIGLSGKGIDEVYSNIEEFENDYDIKKSELEGLLKLKEKLEEKIREYNDEEIPEVNIRIQKYENKIQELRSKSLVNTIQEYEERLKIKQENEKNFETQKSILKSLFSFTAYSDEEYISQWTSELKNLEKYKEKGIGLTYKEEVINDLNEKKAQIEENLSSLNDVMTDTKKELQDVERRVNTILDTKDDYLYCTTSNDLENIKEKIDIFLKESYTKKDLILNIIDVFSEIKKQEKEKISKLLSKKSNVSEYFKEVTNGVYNSVIFEMETGKIKVIRKDNQIFDIEKISGGTYDQLYFTIRLALGEQTFQDKTGFFILDDPFIKSDSERLKRQIEMLKKIISFGWQVLYFTSKDEIVENLREDINNGKVKFIELPTLIS
jgi:DNA repair exonuclease SbcCD ATPase subunit